MKKIGLILIILILFSSLLIISNYNLKVFKEEGIKSFLGIYYSWIVNAGTNFLSFTGNAVKMEWFPENITKNLSK